MKQGACFVLTIFGVRGGKNVLTHLSHERGNLLFKV